MHHLDTQRPDSWPGMAQDEVHIWLLTLDKLDIPAAQLNAMLSHSEQQRAARFHQPLTGVRYARLHLQLRRVLSHYSQIPPDRIHFSSDACGKPILQGHALHFNISRSGSLALMAFCSPAPVGIDIECHQADIDHMAIADGYFSPHERTVLANAHDEQEIHHFYQIWTRKEAYLKALGTGLSRPLHSFSVCEPTGLLPSILADHQHRNASDCWQLHDLNIAADVSAALATTVPITRCRIFALRSLPESTQHHHPPTQ